MPKLSAFHFGLDEYTSILTALYCMNGRFADMVEDVTDFSPEEWENYHARMDNIRWSVYEQFPCAGDPCKNPPPSHEARMRADKEDRDIIESFEDMFDNWDGQDIAGPF